MFDVQNNVSFIWISMY